jgi:hypothetical protein
VEQINKGFGSTTMLTTSGSPSFVGQPVTFTATVSSTHGSIPDGELVTFYDATTAIGTGGTSSGDFQHLLANREDPYHQGNLRRGCHVQAKYRGRYTSG